MISGIPRNFFIFTPNAIEWSLCWQKNVFKGCVIKTAYQATFDHVFWPAEYICALSTHITSSVKEVSRKVGAKEGRGEDELSQKEKK